MIIKIPGIWSPSSISTITKSIVVVDVVVAELFESRMCDLNQPKQQKIQVM